MISFCPVCFLKTPLSSQSNLEPVIPLQWECISTSFAMASRPYVICPHLFFQVTSPTSVPLVLYIPASQTCFPNVKCAQLIPTFIFALPILFKYYLFREILNHPKSISLNSFCLPLSSFIFFIVYLPLSKFICLLVYRFIISFLLLTCKLSNADVFVMYP